MTGPSVLDVLKAHFDLNNPCVDYLLCRYGEGDPSETGLINYDHSDFVNLDMCYTLDLVRFYDSNKPEVLDLVDQAIEEYGYNSRLEMCGYSFQTPEDFKGALVNAAMTYLARSILNAFNSHY